jgi:hypothetical protein
MFVNESFKVFLNNKNKNTKKYIIGTISKSTGNLTRGSLGWAKGETIHRMYRNHDYFGDSSVHDMWRPITI